MHPALSIIVPIYKAEKFLHKCISSILNQTFSDFQLILINDGSPDNCGGICEHYAKLDKRIQVLSQPNLGIVLAVKNALEYAVGKYIGFVDSDDWIEPDMYQKLMEQGKGCDIAACAWQEIRKKGATPVPLGVPSGLYDKEKIEKVIYPTLLEDNGDMEFAALRISRTNKIYQRQLILDNLKYYKENIKATEDYSFYLAVMLDAKSIFVLQNDYLYNYFIHSGSTTSSPNADYWQESLICVRNLQAILQAKDRTEFAPRVDLLAARFASTAIVRAFSLGKEKGLEQIKQILATPEVQQGLAIPCHSYDFRVRLLLKLMRKDRVHDLYALSYLYNTIKKRRAKA